MQWYERYFYVTQTLIAHIFCSFIWTKEANFVSGDNYWEKKLEKKLWQELEDRNESIVDT